jgi:hypothetical protein
MLLLKCQSDLMQVAQEAGVSEIQSRSIPALTDSAELENKWHMPNGGIVILNFVDDVSV